MKNKAQDYVCNVDSKLKLKTIQYRFQIKAQDYNSGMGNKAT
jgi:hypothetical protein